MIHHCTFSRLVKTQIGNGNDIIQQRGGRVVIIRSLPGKPKCPECGSENVKSKWSLTNIVACVGRILGVPTVKIWEKK